MLRHEYFVGNDYRIAVELVTGLPFRDQDLPAGGIGTPLVHRILRIQPTPDLDGEFMGAEE